MHGLGRIPVSDGLGRTKGFGTKLCSMTEGRMECEGSLPNVFETDADPK